MDNLLNGLIASKTRIRLLIRLFLNPQTRAYLRGLATEFGISTNAVREELNQLTKTRLLNSFRLGRIVYYTANPEHPLFSELQSIVSKVIGVDQVINGIIHRLGELDCAYLIDDYAEGRDTGIVDLLLVGHINTHQLDDLRKKTERYIGRKIRTLVLTRKEFEHFQPHLVDRPRLFIWGNGKFKLQ
jgi:hypothetical protein